MKEELEKLSAIKPWKNVKFNLDRISKTPKEFIVDKEIHDKLRDGINELRHDGASHIWTTFKIDEGDVYDIDATMNDETASLILSHIGKKNLLFQS